MDTEQEQTTKKYQDVPKEKVLIYDVETTGLSYEDDEILQLSIIDGTGKNPVQRIHQADILDIVGTSRSNPPHLPRNGGKQIKPSENLKKNLNWRSSRINT